MRAKDGKGVENPGTPVPGTSPNSGRQRANSCDLVVAGGHRSQLANLRAQSAGLHRWALELALKPGREAHANVVSRKAAKVDAEIRALEPPLTS